MQTPREGSGSYHDSLVITQQKEPTGRCSADAYGELLAPDFAIQEAFVS